MEIEAMRSRMPGYILRRARAGMILVPAACVSLTAVAGCSGAASTASTSMAQLPVVSSTAAHVAAGSSAAVSATASSSGGSSSGYSAVVNMHDGQGDSYTQTFTFGSPEPESDVPDAINGLETCQLGVAIPSRNLVVPVQITTTLTTSIQTQIPIEMNVSQYSSTDANSGIPGDVVYQTTAGDQCETGQEGGQATLSQGQSATTQAWIVLQDAIDPAYPNGDPAQLGVNFVYFGYPGSDDVTSAQGSAVCNGDPQTQQQFSPPYLVFAGNAPSGEGCGGNYTAPPD